MGFILNILKNIFSFLSKNRKEVAKETVKTTEIKCSEEIMPETKDEGMPMTQKPLIVINNSKGYSYFSQRNNKYQGNSACGCTSYCMFLLYNKLITRDKNNRWVNSKGEDLLKINSQWLPKVEFTQLEDSLMFFCQHNPNVLEFYSDHYNNLYNDWVKECNELDKRGISEYKRQYKSYPPNELHIVLAYAINLFLHEGKEITEYKNQDINCLIEKLKQGESFIVSGLFEGLNHTVCICGLAYNEDMVDHFIVDDPWKRLGFYSKDLSGNDSEISYQDFIDKVKPKGSIKGAHIIKR